MARYKLTIEYDGTPYVGWQRQRNGPSVQAAIEAAILALTGETVTLRGAGRTDSGVHATGQVAHIDLARVWPGERLADALNFHLEPQPIAVVLAEAVDDGFDARFSARARHYLYRIIDRRPPLVIARDRAWHVKRPLDAAAMDVAAKRLVGHHDFTTFRSTHCQSASALKTLDRLDVVRIGDTVEIRASARSFLHNQVRSMVGSLKHVGAGKWTADDLTAALDARDRKACGPVAPAAGLYLVKVDY